MACFVQIFIYTTIYSKNKQTKKQQTFPYLPNLKLKNKSETHLFFSRPNTKDGHSNM